MDNFAAMRELGLILRGEHPAWGGDCRSNGYSFLVRVADDMPDAAKALGQDIARNLDDYTTETGISPNTLRLAAEILQGSREGAL